MIGRNPDAGGHALHQGEPIAHAGAALSQAKAVMILLHGRGASADGILSLAEAFVDPEIAYFAPQAAGHSWYPHSFLAPLAHNEPWLSSALQVIAGMVRDLEKDGIPSSKDRTARILARRLPRPRIRCQERGALRRRDRIERRAHRPG
jgi:hypothetical protein